MKAKQGFTLIELVVACTLLMMLSTIATTTTDNFIQAVKQLKATNQTLTYRTQVWSLKFMLAQAQLAYANSVGGNQAAIGIWNSSVQTNATDSLIQTLGPFFRDPSGKLIPNITTFASLLQAEGMYDPNNVPIIQLNQLNLTNPATIAALQAASQQGLSLFLPAVTWQGITL
jgi:prepilin-type N-terminal cleavage/methylation domain-containing protein